MGKKELRQLLGRYIFDKVMAEKESIACKERAEHAETDATCLRYENEALLARVKNAEIKITNLHKIISKQQLRISRQANRITELEALWAGTKCSKTHRKLKEKYAILKNQVTLQKLDEAAQ